MELINKEDFRYITDKFIEPQRNMKTFNGDGFLCPCNKKHIFGRDDIKVVFEGMNGQFIVQCPDSKAYLVLIKTKMKWGIVFQGFESIAYSDMSLW